MKTVFFGTPEFAVPTLEAMVAGDYAPALVVTQPARPVGRKRHLVDPPVAAWARSHGFDVAQPERVRQKDFMNRLREIQPDVAVVVAFGQIFRRRLLELPRLGCINVHGSLLPNWRGAAPIQASIAHGEKVTGITTMRMDVGLDSGPTLLRGELEIGPDETAPELSPRLAHLGAKLLVETLDGLARGDLEAEAQDDAKATYAPRLTKDDARIDWRSTAQEIYNRWRAHTPWPGSSGRLDEKVVKILRCRPAAGSTTEPPGTFLGLEGETLHVACGDGTILALANVQVAGKKPLGARDFMNGERRQPGDRFHPTSDPSPPPTREN